MLTSCKMSEEAPRYLKTLPEVGKLTNISRNGNPSEKQVENIDENHEEKERENPILLVEPIPNGDCKVNSGVELGTLEVEYIESENLKDVEDVDMCLKILPFYRHCWGGWNPRTGFWCVRLSMMCGGCPSFTEKQCLIFWEM